MSIFEVERALPPKRGCAVGNRKSYRGSKNKEHGPVGTVFGLVLDVDRERVLRIIRATYIT
jgi:hypothetical protein